MRTSDEILISTLHILARDIQSEDGIANAAILEAAYRLEELVDPNKIKMKNRIWGTYVPERKPKFKIYDNRGHAISALMWRKEYVEPDENNGIKPYEYVYIPDECTLWKLVNDKWVEVEIVRVFKRGEPLQLKEKDE